MAKKQQQQQQNCPSPSLPTTKTENKSASEDIKKLEPSTVKSLGKHIDNSLKY